MSLLRVSFVRVQYARARHRFCRPCRLAWLFTGVVAMGGEEKEEAKADKGSRGGEYGMRCGRWKAKKKDDADETIRAGGAIDRVITQAAVP